MHDQPATLKPKPIYYLVCIVMGGEVLDSEGSGTRVLFKTRSIRYAFRNPCPKFSFIDLVVNLLSCTLSL